MTFTFTAEQLVALVVTTAALLGALAYLLRFARKITLWLRAISNIVDQELTNNHGSSMKDDVHGIAVTVGRIARQVDDLEGRFNNHLRDKDLPWTP